MRYLHCFGVISGQNIMEQQYMINLAEAYKRGYKVRYKDRQDASEFKMHYFKVKEDLPRVIRRTNKISPAAAQGKVANIAREQAKEYLRRHQPFVWNATNITAQMRESLVNLFENYHVHVRIVYLETNLQALLERNRSREDAVPLSVIKGMLGKVVLPEVYEVRKVEWRVV